MDKSAKDEAEKSAKDAADPDHRKDFNSEKQGGPDKAKDSAMGMDEVKALVAKEVAKASAITEAKVSARLNARSAALSKVSPIVGKLDEHAFDTAESVYVYVLEKQGRDTDGLNLKGMELAIDLALEHKQSARKPAPKHGMDAGAGGFDAESLFQREEQ